MNKKGVSQIVTVILLILIVFIAVAVVGNIIMGLLKNAGEGTSDVSIITSSGEVEAGSVYLRDDGLLQLDLTRGSDEAEIKYFRVTISGNNAAGGFESLSYDVEPPIPQGTKTYAFDITPIVSNIQVDVNPLSKSGKSGVKDKYTGGTKEDEPTGGWLTKIEQPCTVEYSCVVIECSGGKAKEKCSKCGGESEIKETGAPCIADDYVSWWKFDDGSGTTASDFVGTNPGTLYSSGELVRNGGAESGTSGWTASTIGFSAVNTDPYPGAQRFNSQGSKTIKSSDSELIPIDTTKKHVLSGWFRSFGVGSSDLSRFGFIPYDKDKKQINEKNFYRVPSTETVLSGICTSGSTALTIASYTNWLDPPSKYIAFGIDNLGSYSDLPNYKIIQINSITRNADGTATITLGANCGSINGGADFPTGTKVREHRSGYNSYIYTAVSSSQFLLLDTWNQYTGTIEANKISDGVHDRFKWWPGTKFVKIMMITNNGQDDTYITGIDDISLTTIPPTHTGATWATDGSKKVLNFDGIDDYVDVTHKDNLNPGTGDFTISLWAKAEDKSGSPRLIWKNDAAASFKGYYVMINGGKWRVGFGDGATKPGVESTDIVVGDWYHVVGVRDKTTNKIRLYINGAFIPPEVDGTTGNINYAGALGIGARVADIGTPCGSGACEFFKGSIDNVMIYNRALSDSEVSAIYNLQK